MKGIFKKFALVLLALACALGLTACKDPQDDCKHTYVDGVCTECGEKDPTYKPGEDEIKDLAEGVFSYVAASYADRTEILGILEKYAVEAGLTGITVFEDSGYILYNPK